MGVTGSYAFSPLVEILKATVKIVKSKLHVHMCFLFLEIYPCGQKSLTSEEVV